MENINVYENADLIVQVNGFCGRKKKDKCKGCYIKSFSKKVLNVERYLFVINTLKQGDLIVLRGGEPTLVKDWFEKFVSPALYMGMRVIIESNGSFIQKDNYYNILQKLIHPNLFVRISFDSSHNPTKKDFDKMVLFANDAKGVGINFAFYSLDMNKEQISWFIKGTGLDSFSNYFHPLLYYKDISLVKLKGKYLSVDGKLPEKII